MTFIGSFHRSKRTPADVHCLAWFRLSTCRWIATLQKYSVASIAIRVARLSNFSEPLSDYIFQKGKISFHEESRHGMNHFKWEPPFREVRLILPRECHPVDSPEPGNLGAPRIVNWPRSTWVRVVCGGILCGWGLVALLGMDCSQIIFLTWILAMSRDDHVIPCCVCVFICKDGKNGYLCFFCCCFFPLVTVFLYLYTLFCIFNIWKLAAR